jgi:hypothetical protein
LGKKVAEVKEPQKFSLNPCKRCMRAMWKENLNFDLKTFNFEKKRRKKKSISGIDVLNDFQRFQFANNDVVE